MSLRRPMKQEEPPADWTPTQAVDEPIINSPYMEPIFHWVYQQGRPYKTSGRRPASYWFKSRRTGNVQADLFAEEERDDLPLVNKFRQDVGRWRTSGYRGASSVTKDLLAYWTRLDRPRRLFFCQQEAVETFLYLLEMAFSERLLSTGYRNFEIDASVLVELLKGEKPPFPVRDPEFFPRLVDIPAENGFLPLRRLGCKMATGSGKTIVMAMIIAWAFCNRGRNPATASYPNGVLVCAPNLTVKERLQVLRPENRDNFYDAFDLIPSKYRELMGVGKVLITNWHIFAPKSPNREGDTSYRVVNKGEETPEAFTKDRLGELATRLPILVLNDEGHHCWRPKPGSVEDQAAKAKGLTKEEKDNLEEEVEEARVWLAGLDRINNAGLLGKDKPCILTCIDMSATPFHLGNSGYPEGSPFPWLVSDFGLVDAIECGIVKIPRLPVRDDAKTIDEIGRPDPKYYRLWRHINDELRPVDRLSNGRPKPDAVYREAEGALAMLAGQWKKRFDEICQKSPGEYPVPPVLIVVCDNTEISEIVYQKVSGEKVIEIPSNDGKSTVRKTVYEESAILPEFANGEGVQRTVRIDTKLLAKVDTEEGETKDQAALALRKIIGSVGKKGEPGEQVRCVVSVSMLTEGWDANNVTHVLGIRAFGSQLLCEQVVGRGLRRMDYRADPDSGMLVAEHVDVYGIPFSLIPFKGKAKEKEGPDPVYHHIFALPERQSFEIRLPVVESYTYDLKGSGIRCDVDSLEGFIVSHEPTRVYLQPTRGYIDSPTVAATNDFVEQDRTEYYRNVRFQQIIFKLAHLILDDLVQGRGRQSADKLKSMILARHQLFPELVKIVDQYIKKKVQFAKGVDKRELGLQKYATMLKERIRDNILPAVSSSESPLLPVLNSYKSFNSTADVNYRTARPVFPLVKSHLNLAVQHSGWEKDAVDVLEDLDFVEYYTPNDRYVGLVVPYQYMDSTSHYEPDFVVRLRGGKHVMLEIKGRKGEIWNEDKVEAKNTGAKKWVAAINNAGRYGIWVFEICKEVKKLADTLSKHVTGALVLPFKKVELRPDDRYKTCVPLSTLRAAASRWSEEQTQLEFDDITEWVTFDTKTRFESGMFVAKVQGDSMEPEIPNGAYCLFRAARGGTRQGKRLLVWHSSISDAQTGGQYTLKVYSSEKAMEADGGWHHTRIILKPLNPAYDPIILTPQDEAEVRVIAEFVEVIK